MEYRSLGRTGVKVSAFCLGLGGHKDEDVAVSMAQQALDAGVNFFDTANAYGRGYGEQITGEALKRAGRRHQVILATKVHGVMDPDDPNARGNSRRHIIEQCEASLRRLQTDYLDVYLLHRSQADIPIDETLRALDDLVRAGKVRYIGTSNFGAWQVVEALWASKELGLNRFVVEQPPFNLLDRRIERELLPMARTFGLGVMVWSPLAGGILTGKYRRGAAPPADSRIARMGSEWADLDAPTFDTLDELEKLAADQGCSLDALSLAWCVQQPGVTSAVIGPRTPEQLAANLAGHSLRLSDDVLARLDAIVRPGGVTVPLYEGPFGPHPFRVW